MARYHLYYLRQGMLVGSGDIEAIDDDDAARIAADQADGHIVEIWNAHERIRVLTPAPEATH